MRRCSCSIHHLPNGIMLHSDCPLCHHWPQMRYTHHHVLACGLVAYLSSRVGLAILDKRVWPPCSQTQLAFTPGQPQHCLPRTKTEVHIDVSQSPMIQVATNHVLVICTFPSTYFSKDFSPDTYQLFNLLRLPLNHLLLSERPQASPQWQRGQLFIHQYVGSIARGLHW